MHTCTVCTPLAQRSYRHLIMEVPAPSKGFHLWWPGTILWLINSAIDWAKCSPWAQVLTSSKEIPWYLFQESTVRDWMTDASWRKWPWFRQLSWGISEYYFKCFLNNCHRNVKWVHESTWWRSAQSREPWLHAWAEVTKLSLLVCGGWSCKCFFSDALLWF